ncbi:MAG: hypothetical protein QOJ63_3640 [Solirubrobacteraceae bacterium]|nr:hypothetical protein [Solirubrobacteraceae bacterium]
MTSAPVRQADAIVRRLGRHAAAFALWLVVLAAVGTADAVATASGRAAQPVAGGGGFADAPLLTAGIHEDTLLPRETLFYAVALRTGQRLTVRATIDVGVGSRSVQDIPDAASGFPTVALFTPLHQRLPSEDPGNSDADLESQSAVVASPRVLTATAAGRAAARNEAWTGPGIYHVAVVLSEITRDLGSTVELPLRLAIEIDGPASAAAPGSQDGPGPLGDPRAGPIADVRPAAYGGAAATSASFGVAPVICGAVVALLLGASAGYLGAGRRRSPAGPNAA